MLCWAPGWTLGVAPMIGTADAVPPYRERHHLAIATVGDERWHISDVEVPPEVGRS